MSYASMRPAQIAREIREWFAQRYNDLMASMRPAQIAREINSLHCKGMAIDIASMRPAQIAREIAQALQASINAASLQ